MSDDLDRRLSELLATEASRLPPRGDGLEAVVGRGRRRRLRSRLATGVGVVAVVALAVGVGGDLAASLGVERSETVVAADGGAEVGPVLTYGPVTTVDGPIMTIEPWQTLPEPSTTTSSPTTTTSSTTTSSTTAPTTTAPTTTTTTAPPPDRRSTDDVIGMLADEEVLFFSNGDDCRGIEGGQGHPDWIEGQPSEGRNEDGTPTYGFAYNTGDSTRGEISWGFEPQSFALSGDCVLSMAVDGAYENRRAIRIFRRYDRRGRDMPDEAFYSVWFYFPQEVSYDARADIGGRRQFGFWNVFQIKNRVVVDDGTDQSLSALSFNAGKVTGDDSMSFYLWSKTECGRVEECPAAHSIDQVTAEPRPIPVGEWVHLELRLVSRSDDQGRIEMWQDGVKIFDYTGVTEREGAHRRNWSVNSYGILHRPDAHVLYADDALISTRAIHPLLFE